MQTELNEDGRVAYGSPSSKTAWMASVLPEHQQRASHIISDLLQKPMLDMTYNVS